MSTRRNQAASRRQRRGSGRGPRSAEPAATAARLRRKGFKASLALVLGTGFQGLFSDMEIIREVSYKELPGFPQLSVAGHAGRVILARLGPTLTVVLDGRAHFYEGHPLDALAFPIRVLAALGVRHLVLTNAAGGIHHRLNPGDFMLLRDHINFMGVNPLRGSVPPGCERFVDLSEVYDRRLRGVMRRAARAARVPLREGVYLAVSGPSYETPSEIRAFGRMGADAVGMSTVPEAIVARQHRVQVVGLSCITNRAAGLAREPLSHADVLQRGAMALRSATNMLLQFGRLYAEVQ